MHRSSSPSLRRPSPLRRPVCALAVLFAVLGSLLVLALPASAASADPYSEQRLFDLINGDRAARGLAVLRPAADLVDVARRQAAWMADNQTLQHNPTLATDVGGWTVLSENVGYTSSTPVDLHTAFMNSAGHRANILDSRVSQLGVGAARDASGTLWVTQVFRQPDASAQNVPSAGFGVGGDTPDVAVPWQGALYVADRAPDGSTNVRTLTDSGFTPGIGALGGVSTSAPAITTSPDGSAAVAIRGRDGAIWMRQGRNGIWDPWFSLGGVFSSRPALASWGPGRLDVVVRGMDGNIYHRAQTSPGVWTPWEAMDGWSAAGTDPAIVATGPGTFTVAIQGRDAQIWARSWAGSTWWGGWGPLVGWSKGGPSLASPVPGQYVVSIKGRDDALYTLTVTSHRPEGWRYQGGSLNGLPRSAGANGRVDVTIVGWDGLLYRNSAVYGNWSGWRRA